MMVYFLKDLISMPEVLMKFRPHRGSLAEAMAESVKIEATMAALEEHVKKTVGFFQKDEVLKVEPYATGEPDTRIGWEKSYIVLGKEGVYGWCDTQPSERPRISIPVVKTTQGVTYYIRLYLTDEKMFDYDLQNKTGSGWRVYNHENYPLFRKDEQLYTVVTLKTSTKSLKEALQTALIIQRRRYLAKKKRTDKVRKK